MYRVTRIKTKQNKTDKKEKTKNKKKKTIYSLGALTTKHCGKDSLWEEASLEGKKEWEKCMGTRTNHRFGRRDGQDRSNQEE